jgi:hypothetical protein
MATDQNVATALDDVPAALPGEILLWTPATAAERAAAPAAVQGFESLDTSAGRAAAAWLRDEALENDPATKTYLVFSEGRVEGFFACCGGAVLLTVEDAAGLRVPHYEDLPAWILAWIARRRDGTVSGLQLMLTAYGLAREHARSLGLVALALDPLDDDVAALWRKAPYSFQTCIPKRRGRRARLWLPLETPEPPAAGPPS